MYHMLSEADLAQVLNQFSVSMFAVERQRTAMPFTIICLNEAMQAGLADPDRNLVGCPMSDLLPQKERDILHARLSECAALQDVARFRDCFSLMATTGQWDVTLQPARLSDGRERIVATVIAQHHAPDPQPDTVTFEDIQYFSSMADYQIQNLISLFESMEKDDLFETAAEQRIARLGGMCRTVQRAVTDIRKSIKNARTQEMTGSIHTRRQTDLQQFSSLNRCGKLKALTEFSAEPNN